MVSGVRGVEGRLKERVFDERKAAWGQAVNGSWIVEIPLQKKAGGFFCASGSALKRSKNPNKWWGIPC